MATSLYQYTSLYVRISEAKKLPARDMVGHRDPFCVLKVDNETIGRTATQFKTLEPFWGEEYRLHVPNEFQVISVYVYDYDTMGSKEPVGKVMLDREAVVRSPRGVDKWFPLTSISRDDEVQGEILVEMSIDPFNDDEFRGTITLVEARDLAAKSDGKTDHPFASIVYNEEEFSTTVMHKTRFPRWKKTFELVVPRPLTDPAHSNLKIVVYDFDRLSHNHFLGQVEVDLADLQVGQRYKTWYRLQHNELKHKDKKKELGSLRLKVQCREERILENKLYTPFIALMLKTVEDPTPEGSPILEVLEEVMTMDRNELGHTLVRFYLAHGSVLPFLDTITLREVHSTTVSANLFRGNSLASKSFDQFMKVIALPYLHETLSYPIDIICGEHKLCELDVEQLKQASKARSGHTATSSAVKTVETSVIVLTGYLEAIMDAIFSSVEHCPPLLRLALRQLWLRVAQKYTDPKDMDVPYLAVSGFLFLRFFVPAILSPKLFSLREEHSDQRTERTLKLIAKVLQCISSLQDVMDVKEQFMQVMNHILPYAVTKMKAFIEELVQIDQKRVMVEVGVKDGGYIHHLILCKGFLWKRSATSGVGASLQYRRRYFELSNIALSYSQNEKKTGDIKSYPVHWIKVVEKLDDGAFNRKHMFQVVVVPSGPTIMPNTPPQVTLYLQASDVNEQNRWVSVIRKACLTNRNMSPVYHTGAFKKNKWSCCRTSANQEPGCSWCHRGITIGDWRDPLDPDLDSQVVFSQFNQGKSTILKKYLGGDDESASTQDGSTSPTSLTSAGASSLHQDEDVLGKGGVAGEGAVKSDRMETNCRELMAVVEELVWHHSQFNVT